MGDTKPKRHYFELKLPEGRSPRPSIEDEVIAEHLVNFIKNEDEAILASLRGRKTAVICYDELDPELLGKPEIPGVAASSVEGKTRVCDGCEKAADHLIHLTDHQWVHDGYYCESCAAALLDDWADVLGR